MLQLVSMAAILFFTGAHSLAFGDEYRVDSHEDFPHWKPGSGVCETAPGDGRCTLRAAIMEANARPGTDHIFVPSGIYLLSTAAIVDDHSIFGDLDITDALVLEGAGVGATILDADRRDRILDVHGVRVEVSGLSLQNGNTVEIGEPGGAVRSSGDLALTRVDVSDSKGLVDEHCSGAAGKDAPDARCGVIGENSAIASTGLLTLIDVRVDELPVGRAGEP